MECTTLQMYKLNNNKKIIEKNSLGQRRQSTFTSKFEELKL